MPFDCSSSCPLLFYYFFNILPCQSTRGMDPGSDAIGTSRLSLVKETLLSVKCTHAKLINHTCI